MIRIIATVALDSLGAFNLPYLKLYKDEHYDTEPFLANLTPQNSDTMK